MGPFQLNEIIGWCFANLRTPSNDIIIIIVQKEMQK